jgi:hypothetical protein
VFFFLLFFFCFFFCFLFEAFEGTASTIPTQVRFTLAATDYTDNPTWFTSCASASMEKTIKNALARDPTQFVNVYFCAPADDTLGWAYFPDDYPETRFLFYFYFIFIFIFILFFLPNNPNCLVHGSKLHGIFILHTALPGGTPPYDLGMTLVHEMGHYLGTDLRTWHAGCAIHDNFISALLRPLAHVLRVWHRLHRGRRRSDCRHAAGKVLCVRMQPCARHLSVRSGHGPCLELVGDLENKKKKKNKAKRKRDKK